MFYFIHSTSLNSDRHETGDDCLSNLRYGGDTLLTDGSESRLQTRVKIMKKNLLKGRLYLKSNKTKAIVK